VRGAEREGAMIPQIKKILYATDLSKNSAYAFRHAVDLAERRNAEIVILHALEPIPARVKTYIKGFADEINWDEKMKFEEEAAVRRIEKRIEEFCRRESQEVKACVALVSKILVRPGQPAEEILRATEDETCDAIVLGTHSKGFLKQTFLGSVARSVLDRSRKPVFVVPLPEGETDLSLEI